MLRRTKFICVAAFALGAGCDHTPPSDDAATQKAIDEAFDKAHVEVQSRLAEADADLRAKAVWFVIDGAKDEAKRALLTGAVQKLKDPNAKNNSFISAGGACYFADDTAFLVSPISDIDHAAKQVTFGRVLAVDPQRRTVLIDAAAKQQDKPTEGWPGAAQIDAFILKKTAKFAATMGAPELIKKFGREKCVVVWMPGQAGVAPGKLPVVKRLTATSPDTLAGSWPGYGIKQRSYVQATVAPVENVDDLAKQLKVDALLAVDPQERVILLGSIEDLRPPTAAERAPTTAKTADAPKSK